MVVIEIEKGKIRGKTGIDRKGKEFFSFQNIPYAAPPIGNLRFKAPQDVNPWSNIRDATVEGNECISYRFITGELIGSEDCLNLNVYTPEIHQNSAYKPLKPVMFWIHGGLFRTGSNKTDIFGPEFLVAEDVVLVTVNYRLGILGFLSLDEPLLGVPGNAGFKDIVMALRWVQNNIVNFCGDPNNVTVFGESAGGAAAHLLMLSPMSKGLLHKVIAQSGTALNTWVYGRRSARIITKELGFCSFDDRKILPFLQGVPAEKILEAQIKIDTDDFMEYDLRFFGVIVERASNEEAFLTERPLDIILSGNYNQIPLMIGYNLREGMSFDDIVPERSRLPFFMDMELSVPLTLNIQRGSKISKEIADQIQKLYFGDIQQNRNEHLQQYSDLCTDTCFLKDLYIAIKAHIKTSTKPIFFYRMSLETELNLFKRLTGTTVPGVYHGDDIGYIFKTIFTPEIEPGSIEDLSQRRFTRLWSNFARYGNPTPDPSDTLLSVVWKQVQNDKMCFLDIGEDLVMNVNPEPERMAFWKNVHKINPVLSKL